MDEGVAKVGMRLGAVAGTAVLLWAALAVGIPAASAGTGDWPTYLLSNARTGFNSNEPLSLRVTSPI
jgi:hypothetical protein